MIKHGSLWFVPLVGIGFAFLAPTAARADLIDVQFGSTGPNVSTQFSGAALTGIAGDQWNYFQSGSGSSSLIDSSGLPTGISIEYSANGAYGVVPDRSAFFGTPYANLMQSFIYTQNAAITITFQGLSPGQAFDLYIYGQSDQNSGNYGGTVTVNGIVQTALQDDASTFTDNNNYLLFQGAANANGMISISDAIAPGREQTMVNGLQLITQPVPEPASLLLFGVGIPALGLVRRRRQIS